LRVKNRHAPEACFRAEIAPYKDFRPQLDRDRTGQMSRYVPPVPVVPTDPLLVANPGSPEKWGSANGKTLNRCPQRAVPFWSPQRL
jgi:hypothetical protein